MEELKLSPELEAEVQALEKKEKQEQDVLTGPTTEVTSLIEEERKTPEQAPKITQQDYVAKAVQDHFAGLMQIQSMLERLSKKAYKRILLSLLKLPEEGVKVNFQSDDERKIFGIGQRVLNARTTLILSHMKSKISEDRVKKQAEAVSNTVETTSENKEIANG